MTGLFTLLIRFIWRLLPLLVILYGLRHGTAQARKAFKAAQDVVLVTISGSDLNSAKSVIELQFIDGTPPPDDIVKFMRKNVRSRRHDVGVDPWGTEYKSSYDGRNLTIYSCGPDTVCGNSDDLNLVIRPPSTARPDRRQKFELEP
jgi:hypothetical protein